MAAAPQADRLAGPRALVVDDREASALEVRETVAHGLQLLGRVAIPVHQLTDDLDGPPSAVGPRGIARELLVRHVGVVLQGTQRLHDVDPAPSVSERQLGAHMAASNVAVT